MPKVRCKACQGEVEVEEGYRIRICNGGFEHKLEEINPTPKEKT
jgi:hypothetical protein